MIKEPLSLYLLRLFLWVGLVVILAMLYWSSALIEEDFQSVKNQLSELSEELSSIKMDLNKISKKNGPVGNESNASQDTKKTSSQTDPTLPNLLSEDPFYSQTLPKLLPANFKPDGIRKEATVGKPDNLHPFNNWSHIASWTSGCTVAISSQHFGRFETYAPEMAIKMELRKDSDGQPEYWLHFRDDVYWRPINEAQIANDFVLDPFFTKKHQVTAHDFKFYIDAILNPFVEEAQAVALRTYFSDIKDIEVIDDLTLVVRWKTKETVNEEGKKEYLMKYAAKSWTASLRPLPSFVFKYFPNGKKIVENDSDPNTYRTNKIWAQNFSQHWAKNVIISCGPWVFEGITDREIHFKRNDVFFMPLATLVAGLEVKFKDSPDSIWEEFKSGSLDLFQVPPNQLAEVDRFLQSEPYKEQARNGLAIKRLNFVDRAYTYIGWNQANPLFKSKKVRQALTMAIDRRRIIERNLNGMGIEITGTFFPFSPSYDQSIIPYPFSLQQSKALLEEEGWFDSDADGIIDKSVDGKQMPFRFRLTYYVKNPTTKSICEYIATTLREIGIECITHGVDIADLSAAFEDKSFDAIILGWALGTPPEDPRQLWHSSGAKEKGSSNAIGFANVEVDAIIEQLEYEYNPEKRVELYHRFDRILYDEAPYTFLYTPKVALLFREYLQNVFIPAERQDLIPGANVGEPQPGIYWIKKSK